MFLSLAKRRPYSYEKSLQALSKYGRMDAVELEKEIDYEIS
ncbi:hypothetical protein SORDD17_00655 [Streptococcus oralis]|uniref:Uncharacterized protein n=1 Tax=Streptococcus oralis TaxID=1303 RepID=A0A139RN13_STROR|nr:hypothetical protein SORDD17_00655 [Streptococcus oralis]